MWRCDWFGERQRKWHPCVETLWMDTDRKDGYSFVSELSGAALFCWLEWACFPQLESIVSCRFLLQTVPGTATVGFGLLARPEQKWLQHKFDTTSLVFLVMVWRSEEVYGINVYCQAKITLPQVFCHHVSWCEDGLHLAAPPSLCLSVIYGCISLTLSDLAVGLTPR